MLTIVTLIIFGIIHSLAVDLALGIDDNKDSERGRVGVAILGAETPDG